MKSAMSQAHPELPTQFSTFSYDEIPDTVYEHNEASEEAWRQSMFALEFNKAIVSFGKIPEMDYYRRLSALTDALDRFGDDVDPGTTSHVQGLMDEYALNLAAKTLPLKDIADITEGMSIPVDDIGFARPPSLTDAMAVAVCWDKTRTDATFQAAYLMFEACDTPAAQDTEALKRALQHDTHFRDELQEILQHDVREIPVRG